MIPEAEIHTLLGEHSAEIRLIAAAQLVHRKELEAVRTDVHAIRILVENYMASVAGGWKVLMVLGAVLATIAGGLGWIYHQWKGP